MSIMILVIENSVEHCIDCLKYPCDQIVGSKKANFLLPHLKSNHTNMERINEVGVAKWVSGQAEKWKCPGCGTSFSWYTRRCLNCGANLKDHSLKLSVLKLILLKIWIYTLLPKIK
jgi:hypothetical protein